MTAKLKVLILVIGTMLPTRCLFGTEPFEDFLKRHCMDCHSGEQSEASFDLTKLEEKLDTQELLAKWIRVHDRVESGEMPPKEVSKPPMADRNRFLESLSKGLTQISATRANTILRRLNRTEYENTLNDLLGVRESLVEMLPEDGSTDGFDNVGESLDLSSVHLERYIAAADQAISAAIRKFPKPERKTETFSLGDGKNASNLDKHWLKRDDGAVVVFNSGAFPRPTFETFKAPYEGSYRVVVRGYAYQSSLPIRYQLWQGTFSKNDVSTKVGLFAFDSGEAQSHEVDVWLKRGATFAILPQLSVDSQSLRQKGPQEYQGAGLAIYDIQIEGPMLDDWPGPGHRLLFGDLEVREKGLANSNMKKQKSYRPEYEIVSESPQKDAERLLRDFSTVAFRRPFNEASILPLLALFQEQMESGENFEAAMRATYIAALCSPDFLCLRESTGVLSGSELASRLSYAFWNTFPDSSLMQLASNEQLLNADTLRSQVDRMLADSRSSRFIKTFTGQWLKLRDIDFTIPDKQLYPEYDDDLRDAMIAETRSFFETVLKENLKIHDFIHSNWTMLNERLAKHYGIEGVDGDSMRRVSLLPSQHRGGVLTHASILKVTANGTTTSPVVRGVFVLERILGIEPPPPPPGVPGVEPDIRGTSTLREQLTKHRDIESCNNCHSIIDPPGFALESYDVVGGWRENYRSLAASFPAPSTKSSDGGRKPKWRVGPVVDASGQTKQGEDFKNLDDYKKILLANPRIFARSMVEKMAVYLTGRAMGFSDRPELERITDNVARKGYGFRDLIHEVVQSRLFRNK